MIAFKIRPTRRGFLKGFLAAVSALVAMPLAKAVEPSKLPMISAILQGPEVVEVTGVPICFELGDFIQIMMGDMEVGHFVVRSRTISINDGTMDIKVTPRYANPERFTSPYENDVTIHLDQKAIAAIDLADDRTAIINLEYPRVHYT